MKISTAIFLFYVIFNVNIIKASIEHCDIESGNLCLKCSAGYSLIETQTNYGQCQQCEATKDGQSNHCFNKINGCTTYVQYKEGEKCVCDTGKLLINDNKCVNEIPGCDQYKDDDGTCQSCFPGYEYDSKDKTCDDNEGCQSLNDKDECTACIDGCYLEDEACICLPLCKTIQEKKCTECVNTKLKLTDSGCTFYTGISNCKKQKKDICEECKENYILSTNGKSCLACEYSATKTECNIESLPAGCTKVIYDETNNLLVCDGCEEVDGTPKVATKSNQQCTTDGSITINEESISKTEQLDNCITHDKQDGNVVCTLCFPGFHIVGGKCYSCPTHYLQKIGDGRNCFLPHINCADHDNSGNCIRCIDTYELNNGNCVEIDVTQRPRNKNNSYNLNLNIMILIIFGLLL